MIEQRPCIERQLLETELVASRLGGFPKANLVRNDHSIACRQKRLGSRLPIIPVEVLAMQEDNATTIRLSQEQCPCRPSPKTRVAIPDAGNSPETDSGPARVGFRSAGECLRPPKRKRLRPRKREDRASPAEKKISRRFAREACPSADPIDLYSTSRPAQSWNLRDEIENGLLERGNVNRLDKVLAESRFPAPANILLHSISTHGDALERMPLAYLPHELTTGAVGETEIAHQNVKMRVVGSFQRLGHSAGSFHGKSRALEKTLQQQGCVGMIFHDEQAQELLGAVAD